MNIAKHIEIKGRTIAENALPFIICEMAMAHDGKFDIAKSLVDAAVNAGADAVQFEVAHPDDNIVPSAKTYKVLQSLYFTPEQWKALFDYTRQFDIAISAFAYDYKSLDLSLSLGVDMVKLNSSDLLNIDMLKRLGETDLPVTFGTGSSTMMEIASALEYYAQYGGEKVILMHGLQNFPTDMRNAFIRRMQILRASFDTLVGYADHTEGDHYLARVIDLVAVGMGASVIEKHITYDRAAKGIDYQSALNPDEYIEYVKTIRDAGIALGDPRIHTLNASDHEYRQFQKKTIVAAADLTEGTVIQRDQVAFLRVEDVYPELSPIDFLQIEGKTLTRDVKKFEALFRKDLS